MRDSEALSRGEKYRNLKDLYIIFLCPEDIFGHGRAVYRFMNLEVDNGDADNNLDRLFVQI